MASSRAAFHEDPSRGRALSARRHQESSVGELIRHDDMAAPSRGYHRPPRTPCGNAGQPRPHLPSSVPVAPAVGPAAAAVGRPPSGRRPRLSMEELARADVAACRAVGNRAESPSPALELDRPPRIVGAFRALPPGCRPPPRSQSRGRSPSCGPGENSAPRSRASSAGRGGRDIIAENRVAAAQRPRASSAGRAPLSDIKFARDNSNVPLYLQKVKVAITDEERLVAARLGLARNADGAPPGHRMLTADERREILTGLQKRKSDLDVRHSRLPLYANTEAQKQRACDLEKALKEVELDIARFGQPNVMVKL